MPVPEDPGRHNPRSPQFDIEFELNYEPNYEIDKTTLKYGQVLPIFFWNLTSATSKFTVNQTKFYFFLFLLKKITKLVLKKFKPVQIDWFWSGYFRTKTGSNQPILIWIGFSFWLGFFPVWFCFFQFWFFQFQVYKTEPNQ